MVNSNLPTVNVRSRPRATTDGGLNTGGEPVVYRRQRLAQIPTVRMTHTTTNAPGAGAAPAALSLPARVFGVLFSPRATYADVTARPHCLGMLIVLIAIGASATFGFLSTEVGRQAMLDRQIATLESFGRPVTDEMYLGMERGMNIARVTGPAAQAVFAPLMAAIVAGLLFAIFNAIMGGNATFRQVYAIVVHSGVITTLSSLFVLPLAYAQGSMSGATNLRVFFPFLDEASFLSRFLGSIDLFLLWWLISLAIGLGVLYRRKTAPIANGLIGAYVVIGLIIAAVKTALSGA